MDRLTRDEVLHVAMLGRLKLTEEEIEENSYKLKALFKEIDKFNEIDLEEKEELISPSKKECKIFNDLPISNSDYSLLINNAPKTYDKFIEVRGVFDE